MSVLTELKGAERQKTLGKRRERENARWQANEIKKVWTACRRIMRAEVPPLNGRKINDCKITVKKIKSGYRIFTEGFGYDQERTIELTLDTFSGTFRPADDCPEQDYTDHGIRIKWWRRGNRFNSEEMSDGVTIELGNFDRAKNIKETHRRFREALSGHIKRCVGLD